MIKLKNKKISVKIILKYVIRLLVICCFVFGGFQLYKFYFGTTKTTDVMDKLINEIDVSSLSESDFVSDNLIPAEQINIESKAMVDDNVENNEIENKDDCLAVEKILLSKLNKEDSSEYNDHLSNKKVYEKLLQFGCEKNYKKYMDKIRLEERVINSFDFDSVDYRDENKDSVLCERRERILKNTMNSSESMNPEDHKYNAKLYNIMKQYGCESRQDYVEKLEEEELKTAQMLEEIKAHTNQNMNFE